MIKTIQFSNYKIFKNKQTLSLKPVTVIFGKNNSGKSAVLKLPSIMQSALNSQSTDFLDTEWRKKHIKDMRSLVYGRFHRAVSLIFEDEKNNSLDVSFFIEDECCSKIEHWIVKNGNSKMGLESGKDDELHDSETQNPVPEIHFNGVMPNVDKYKLFAEPILKSLRSNIDYIGSFRWLPEMFITDEFKHSNDNDGHINYQFLYDDSKTANQELLKKVSDWYENNFNGWKIKVNRDRNPVYSIEIEQAGNLNVNIADAGVGIAQSLPIVTRANRVCEEPTIIVLEEPETHLHPAAHGNLAELIALSTKSDCNKSYLVETHSINFILRLRRLIAEGKLSVNDVALYSVEFDENECCSKLVSVEINEDGSVNYWPEGVFEETLAETIAIFEAQNKE